MLSYTMVKLDYNLAILATSIVTTALSNLTKSDIDTTPTWAWHNVHLVIILNLHVLA